MQDVTELLYQAYLDSLKGDGLPVAGAMASGDSYLIYNATTKRIETITKQLAAASTHFPLVAIDGGWVKKFLPIGSANLLAIETNDLVQDKTVTDFSVTPNIPIQMMGWREYLGDLNGNGTANWENYDVVGANAENEV